MLTTAHTRGDGERLDVRSAPTACAAGTSRPRWIGSGPIGTAVVSSGFQALGSSGGSGRTSGEHYRHRVTNWCPSVGCASCRLRPCPSPVTPRPTTSSSPIRSRSSSGCCSTNRCRWSGRSAVRRRSATDSVASTPRPSPRCRSTTSKRSSRRSPRCTATPGRWRSARTRCASTSSRSTAATRQDLEGHQGPPGAVRPHPALPGYGDEKAKIFLAILGKRLKVAPKGWEEYAARSPTRTTISRRHRLAREPPARPRLEAGPEGRQEIEGRVGLDSVVVKSE